MDLSRGTWSDAGMSMVLSHEVSRLTHRKEYMFRVKAVNNVGESDPLETAKSIIAKNEFGEWFWQRRIKRKNALSLNRSIAKNSKV